MTDIAISKGQTVLHIDWEAPNTWLRYAALCVVPAVAITASLVCVKLIAEYFLGLPTDDIFARVSIFVFAALLAWQIFMISPKFRRAANHGKNTDVETPQQIVFYSSVLMWPWICTAGLLTSIFNAITIGLLNYGQLQDGSSYPILFYIFANAYFPAVLREFLAVEVKGANAKYINKKTRLYLILFLSWGLLIFVVLLLFALVDVVFPFVRGS